MSVVNASKNAHKFFIRTVFQFHNLLSCALTFFPLDTGRKLKVHKTFRRRPGRLLNVLCTFNLHPVPMWFLICFADFSGYFSHCTDNGVSKQCLQKSDKSIVSCKYVHIYQGNIMENLIFLQWVINLCVVVTDLDNVF